MFFYIYTVIAFILYILAIPFLVILTFKQKYRSSIPARFFLYKNTPLKANGIWFHVCSFGEAKAIKPLIDKIPKDSIRITTTTQTGKSLIETYTKKSRYLPFEVLLFGWIKPQKALVVMEAEFWYLMFAIAKAKGAKTILINARMSDRSYPKYLKMRWFYKQLFKYVDEVFAQSDIDKTRLESLGATNIKVVGNIKLADTPKPTKQLKKPAGLIVCGASTHPNEEELILKAFTKLKAQQPNAKLILVPRHPERFDEVFNLSLEFAYTHNYSIQRYSKTPQIASDIVVVDMLGELINLYTISDIVILGGAFEPIGGHNAIEPAYFGCKIISGEHYFNQKDMFEAIDGITICSKEKLSDTLLNYRNLPDSSIRYQTDIDAILKSLEIIS
jgi:3-deoxy-D-manno-octulosonic-acid transferase